MTMRCDPNGCAKKPVTTHIHENSAAMCCLCDLYNMILKVSKVASDAVDTVLCLSFQILREGKMQFYRFLEAIDNKDLCRSVCSPEEKPNNVGAERGDKVQCKCSKSRTCKRNRAF